MTDLPTIYVFDFDQTITHIHTGGCAMTDDEVGPDYIRSNVKDGLIELVEGLQQLGDRIYIATYGDDRFGRGVAGATSGHALVQRYMDTILGVGQQYFVASDDPPGNIIARCSNDGKRYHLTRILFREGLDGSDPSVLRRILVVDDDPVNVSYFASRGCMTLVPGSPCDAARMAAGPDILRVLHDRLRGYSGRNAQ